MTSIPHIPYDQIKALYERPMRPAQQLAQADIYELTWQGEPAVAKDFSSRPWWIRVTVGRVANAHEARVLARLEGVSGAPKLWGRAGPNAIVIERFPGRRLPKSGEAPPGPEFFARARALLAEVHDQGIGHGDLRRKNILIDDAQNAYLIDFATAITARPGLSGAFSRFLFRRWSVVDRITLARIERDYRGESLGSEEQELLRRQPWYLKFGRFFKKKVLRLRKRRHRHRMWLRFRQWLRGA